MVLSIQSLQRRIDDAMQTAPAKTTKTENRRSMKLVAVTSIAAGVNWVKDQCKAVEYLASKRFFQKNAMFTSQEVRLQGAYKACQKVIRAHLLRPCWSHFWEIFFAASHMTQANKHFEPKHLWVAKEFPFSEYDLWQRMFVECYGTGHRIFVVNDSAD